MSLNTDAARQEYDRLAPDYDRRWRRYVDTTLQAVADVLKPEDDDRVLDIACGTGELERILLSGQSTLRIVGMDLSREMLRQATARHAARQVRWIQAEARRLPFADACFDWAVCANSFHYFRDPVQSLQELSRVLRPGGRLVLVDWCDDYLSCKLCSAWLRWTDPAFYRTYSQQECGTLLERAGMDVLQADRFRVGWLWGLMRFVGRRRD